MKFSTAILPIPFTFCLFTAFMACSVEDKSNPANPQEAWDTANDPLKLGSSFERNFYSLPPKSELSFTPWADSYWPSYKAGIAARWKQNSPTTDNFKYLTPTFAELKAMSQEEIAKLSPAEKFDIANSTYSFPTVARERSRTKPTAATWEGICHGWAPASLLYTEPKPFVFTNKDGIRVSFGSSDVKAMLSYYQGEISSTGSKFLGLRCNADLKKNPELANTPECKGVNAGTFHLIITNQIALKHQGFVADIVRDQQVWNHPIFGYKYKILAEKQGASAGAAPGTVKEITVSMQMHYRVESEPLWETTNSESTLTSIKTYKYVVELNSNNEVIGGTWLVEDRPDFFWTQEKPVFRNNYAILQQIYNQSIADQNPTPTAVPTIVITARPTPTAVPTINPTVRPTVTPTTAPTVAPTPVPTVAPTILPTVEPTSIPTVVPSPRPTVVPQPTLPPSNQGTYANTWLQLMHNASGKCLTIQGMSREEGAALVQFDCHGYQTQRFFMQDTGNIRVNLSKKCLQYSYNEARITQASCKNIQTQHFIIEELPSGVMIHPAQNTNLCFSLRPFAEENNSPILLMPCDYSPNLSFSVRR